MRAVVQRVSSASVTIDNRVTAKIGRGLVILLGIQDADTTSDLEWLTTKIMNLRIFPDRDDKMNLSIQDLSRARVCGDHPIEMPRQHRRGLSGTRGAIPRLRGRRPRRQPACWN